MKGSPLIFFTRPLAAVFMVAWGLWLQFSGRGKELAADDSD
ncbi:hypothetical protein SDD30_01000 [Moorella naiadis]